MQALLPSCALAPCWLGTERNRLTLPHASMCSTWSHLCCVSLRRLRLGLAGLAHRLEEEVADVAEEAEEAEVAEAAEAAEAAEMAMGAMRTAVGAAVGATKVAVMAILKHMSLPQGSLKARRS